MYKKIYEYVHLLVTGFEGDSSSVSPSLSYDTSIALFKAISP